MDLRMCLPRGIDGPCHVCRGFGGLSVICRPYVWGSDVILASPKSRRVLSGCGDRIHTIVLQ